MAHRKTATLAVGLSALLMIACSDESDAKGETRVIDSAGKPEAAESLPKDLAQRAARTLADDLGIPVDQVSVETIRAVDFRDSSLGCPQPGEAYMQVITPGYKITLRVGQAIHFVHSAKGRIFVCHRAKAVGGVTDQMELVFAEQLLAARKDLAARLGVDASSIQMLSGRSATWKDAGMDCPEPGQSYPAVATKGYILTLKHNGREYSYHTDLVRTIACPEITAD
ncbi:MAG: hypothetical protein R3E77_10195 [Steroidobacteraceae bacterium]